MTRHLLARRAGLVAVASACNSSAADHTVMTPQVSSPTPPAAQLSGVQALRGLAACIVVLSHAASHVDKAFGAAWLETVFHPGHAGVDLFFVISGFIILFVHGKDIGRPRRVAHYLSRRFSRVYPLYWTALAITVAIMVAGSHAMPEFRRMVFSIFLMPAPGGQVLGVAWTLECELVFYAVFAVLVLNRSFGRATMAVWLAWIALTGAGYHLLRAPPALNGMYCLEFFFGMAVAQLTRLGPIPQPRLVAADRPGPVCRRHVVGWRRHPERPRGSWAVGLRGFCGSADGRRRRGGAGRPSRRAALAAGNW